MSADFKRELDDVRDEVHAGLGEVRELVEQSRRAVFRMESELATRDPAASLRVVEALDRVTAMAEHTRRRQHWLTGLTLLQSLALIGALAWMALQHDTGPAPVIAEPAQAPATLSTLSDTDTIAPAAATEVQRDPSAQPSRKRRPPKRNHAVR